MDISSSKSNNTSSNSISRSSALAVLSRKNGKKHFIFEDKVLIGRSQYAFLCIPENFISRKHCIIEKTEDNDFTICDMSNSGTFVNNERLQKNMPRKLNHLDHIMLADNEAFSYVFLINKKRFGLKTPPRMNTSSPLTNRMNDLNVTQNLEKETMDKEMDLLLTEVVKLKEEMREKLKAREEELVSEKFKTKLESDLNKEQADKLEKKLQKIMEEKEGVMKEYEAKIADNAKKEEELQKIKNEMIQRHQIERDELESKCKAEIEELKEKLRTSEFEKVKELESKLEEMKNVLLESELEQQRLFEAKVEAETKFEAKIVDLTNYGENREEQAKEFEKKIEEQEKIVNKFKKEIEGIEEDAMCSICAEIFIEPTIVVDCGHLFCKLCITEWIKKKKICPMCRAKVVNTVRIYNMDSMIQRNVRMMSEEAQARREALIAERQKGKSPKKKPAAKKRRRDVSAGEVVVPTNVQDIPYPLPGPTRRSRTVPTMIGGGVPNQIRPFALPPIAHIQRQLESEGVDPFQVGWVTNQHARHTGNLERGSPVTVAAVDLTNMATVEVPAPVWTRSHTVTSADSTIDLTGM